MPVLLLIIPVLIAFAPALTAYFQSRSTSNSKSNKERRN
jgi:hypothetical protein